MLWEWGSDERRFLCKDTQFSEQLSTSSRTHETQGGRIDIPRSLGNATSSLHRKHERCSYSRRNCSAVSEQCRGVSPPGAPRWWAPRRPPATVRTITLQGPSTMRRSLLQITLATTWRSRIKPVAQPGARGHRWRVRFCWSRESRSSGGCNCGSRRPARRSGLVRC